MIKKREGAKINPQGGGCTVKWCSLGNNLVGMVFGDFFYFTFSYYLSKKKLPKIILANENSYL